MSKRILVMMLVFVLALTGCMGNISAEVESRLEGLPQISTNIEGFERAEGPPSFEFPRDHGPHPDFQTEWWYYTGNLEGADGRRFGYQLTFFRRAVRPAAERIARESDWSAEQIYLAHFAFADVSGGKFHAFERFERGAAGLAGASVDPLYRVWLHDWQVEQTGGDTFDLQAQAGEVALALTLTDRKGIILQGDRGYSRKGAEPGNASLYYSQTRLESTGTITVAGETIPVTGLSWLDREISTSVLSEGQVGWDWFAIQLDDGSEMMLFHIRNKDGSIAEYSQGTFIAPDGTTTPLTREDFTLTPEATWRSPHSGGVYPSRWRVQVPGQNIDLRVEPLLADQELQVSVIYWEGAVRISGTRGGEQVNGYGYTELTGYAQSLEGDV